MNDNRRNNGRNENDNNNILWGIGTAVAGVAAAAGIYWLSANSHSDSQNDSQGYNHHHEDTFSFDCSDTEDISNSLQTMNLSPSSEDPPINNLNSLLSYIYDRYIDIKKEVFQEHFVVFQAVLRQLHKHMKAIDVYYARYSGEIKFAGSHYDRLRIKAPDEFDMDIVIGLPLNIRYNPNKLEGSDIIIESKGAGFVQLRMGAQFRNLPNRDEWSVNRTCYNWKDEQNYLLRSNFINWFKSVVMKALNQFDSNGHSRCYHVDGVPYIIRIISESGPAITLIIENRNKGFSLSVDLVPSLKFPEDRWPISSSYRKIPDNCKRGYWLVVPKINKGGQNQHDLNRSWRISLHDQERELMYHTYNMRYGIKYLKKLRDAQNMTQIASYYIKTLFLWEIVERNNPNFWHQTNPATIFKLMVKKLYDALVAGNIPYFWNRRNNLIEHINKTTLDQYASILQKLLIVLEEPNDYKMVAKYLLTPTEFAEYNNKYLHI